MKDARSAYLVSVRRAIERHKTYPLPARRSHQQGTAVVRFQLGCDGQLLTTEIATTSGRSLLDRAALLAVVQVGRFPPFPDELGRANLTFEVPVAFHLDPH